MSPIVEAAGQTMRGYASISLARTFLGPKPGKRRFIALILSAIHASVW